MPKRKKVNYLGSKRPRRKPIPEPPLLERRRRVNVLYYKHVGHRQEWWQIRTDRYEERFESLLKALYKRKDADDLISIQFVFTCYKYRSKKWFGNIPAKQTYLAANVGPEQLYKEIHRLEEESDMAVVEIFCNCIYMDRVKHLPYKYIEGKKLLKRKLK